jgi:hypothetical protein
MDFSNREFKCDHHIGDRQGMLKEKLADVLVLFVPTQMSQMNTFLFQELRPTISKAVNELSRPGSAEIFKLCARTGEIAMVEEGTKSPNDGLFATGRESGNVL